MRATASETFPSSEGIDGTGRSLLAIGTIVII